MIILICIALICIIAASIVVLIIRIACKCIFWLQFGRRNLDLGHGLRSSQHRSFLLSLRSHEYLDILQWLVDKSKATRGQYAIDNLLPTVIYGDNEMKIPEFEVCVICLEDYMDRELCRILPSCRHMFHSHCIEQWLKWNLTCPTCRGCIL
ncbi:protein with unknown function [Ricinus communis]|uniref:RING-type domain-containing protein n=1 Tax=Ricinus communis TaxID=3988 RepID=B9T0D9_RICCO|nr:protein with unknown function [Ricinus communis]|eukprot:XP_002531708.1 putative RING-H2 finger protein ATL19 [Ricinus communis]